MISKRFTQRPPSGVPVCLGTGPAPKVKSLLKVLQHFNRCFFDAYQIERHRRPDHLSAPVVSGREGQYLGNLARPPSWVGLDPFQQAGRVNTVDWMAGRSNVAIVMIGEETPWNTLGPAMKHHVA